MGFKDFVCGILSCNAEMIEDLESVTTENNRLKEYQFVISAKLNTCTTEKQALADELAKCENDESEIEKYWNNRRPKQDIFYNREEKDGTYSIDVRNYFQPYDSAIPIFHNTSNDGLALSALKWVETNITYVPDKTEYGIDEFWCYPYQTLKHMKGDCEDGAILLASIMLKSGIPYWRIRLNAGSVSGGGHAYVTYCRETDNQFVVLDWCYWYKSIPIKDRALHKDEQDYYGIWFSWNQKYAFGSMDTMAKSPNNFIVPRSDMIGKSRK
jgi:predicted transglutaminase-like cysteine proteinase